MIPRRAVAAGPKARPHSQVAHRLLARWLGDLFEAHGFPGALGYLKTLAQALKRLDKVGIVPDGIQIRLFPGVQTVAPWGHPQNLEMAAGIGR